jgi:hypothetical protein
MINVPLDGSSACKIAGKKIKLKSENRRVRINFINMSPRLQINMSL